MFIYKTKKEKFNQGLFALKHFLNKLHHKIGYKVEDMTTNNFQKFKDEILNKGYMSISLDGCNKTIYESVGYNVLARYHYDTIHYDYDLDFSLEDETKVCQIQIEQITSFMQKEGYTNQVISYASELIYLDIIAQGYFYKHNNKFLDDQYEFIYDLFLSDNYAKLVKGV